MQRLGPIVIGVIAAGGGGVVVIIVVTIGIKRAADVVNLALSAWDLNFIPRRTVLTGLHRKHFHLLFEAELLWHCSNLRVLLLLLLRQSLLPWIPGTANCKAYLRQGTPLFSARCLNLNLLQAQQKNSLIDFLSSDHTGGGGTKRSPGSFRCLGRG